MPKNNILLTGLPRSGKTTVIIKIAEYLKGDCCGFFTREIKHHGRRQGFQIVSVADPCHKKTLAHVSFSSKYKVSKYGVAPEALNPFIKELYKNMETKNIFLIDEIGKMELFHPDFKTAMLGVFDSQLPVIATIMSRPHPFCNSLKERQDTVTFQVTKENRNNLPVRVLDYLGDLNNQ